MEDACGVGLACVSEQIRRLRKRDGSLVRRVFHHFTLKILLRSISISRQSTWFQIPRATTSSWEKNMGRLNERDRSGTILRRVASQSWLQVPLIHDIRTQHILLSAVHDSALVPNGM